MRDSLLPTKLSVALCTFNGELFLAKQLASMLQQTRLPDELVVCDDMSTDRTLVILRAFAASSPFPVTIVQNDVRLGSTGNFEKAMRLCTGNLVALSDQDDIWYPTRLGRSEEELAAHPEAGLVFSDASVIDEQDRPLDRTLWQRLGFNRARQQALLSGHFALLAKHRFVTGATIMFRAHLRDRFLPIPAGWIHDEWMAMVIASFASVRPIDQPLIRYRLHTRQQVGLQNKLEQRAEGSTRSDRHWARLRESASELQQLCHALCAMDVSENSTALYDYQQHLRFLAFRCALPAARLSRAGQILTHARQYKQHASGFSSMLKDFLLFRSR